MLDALSFGFLFQYSHNKILIGSFVGYFKMQYVHYRSHTNYFLLPLKVHE